MYQTNNYKMAAKALLFAIFVSVTVVNAKSVMDDQPSFYKRAKCDPNKKDHMFCSIWKDIGYCNKTHFMYKPLEMEKNCPFTCGLCPGISQPKHGPEPVAVKMVECLQAHNSKRALHGAAPLTWDPLMAFEAEKDALKFAKLEQIWHDPQVTDGENVAWIVSGLHPCKDAANGWYNQVKNYPFSKPPMTSFGGNFGKSTQVVWKSTKRLGVGIVRNGYHTYVVARYSPRGNVHGKFAENVGVLRKGL